VDFVAMSKLSSIPAGGETPPVPSLPKAPMTRDSAAGVTEGARITPVFVAKLPLVARSGAAVSRPPKARTAPAAYRYLAKRHVYELGSKVLTGLR
jgi:hypothetical protein